MGNPNLKVGDLVQVTFSKFDIANNKAVVFITFDTITEVINDELYLLNTHCHGCSESNLKLILTAEELAERVGG
jgi:hypothetical protein